MSITSPVTDAASLLSVGLATELVVIRPKLQPTRSPKATPAAAHCGVPKAESNALSQLSRLARDGVSRLWTLDQTFALKSVGRFGRGRLERALRSSSKRDSFIFLCRTTQQTFGSSYLLSHFNETKGLIPQNFGYFFHKQRLFHSDAIPARRRGLFRFKNDFLKKIDAAAKKHELPRQALGQKSIKFFKKLCLGRKASAGAPPGARQPEFSFAP